MALETINPRRATPNFYRLYVNFSKFYEEGGATGTAEKDLDGARKILEKATKVQFKTVEDLAEVWCEWSELELRHESVLLVSYICSEGSYLFVEIMRKPFELCNGLLSYQRTPK